ncbi:MAG TPA: hypothetical protein VNP92_27800 [Actinophytocola sp.]|nr:hypothetical protein [Actinophytocola sp.]
MDIGDWTALIMGIAGLLVAVISAPASAARRRPVLITSGVLVLVALGLGLAGLPWPSGGRPEPGSETRTAAPTTPSTTTPQHEPIIVPSTAVTDDHSEWAGTVQLTSYGLDLDTLPAESADGSGNDLMLMTTIGTASQMMLTYRKQSDPRLTWGVSELASGV